MNRRTMLAAGLLIVSLVGIGGWAQIPRPGQVVPKPTNLTVTMNPADTQPAQLNYISESQTFEAQGATVKATYTATGLVIEMSTGRYVSTIYRSPWAGEREGRFKTLHMNFASDGLMTSFRTER